MTEYFISLSMRVTAEDAVAAQARLSKAFELAGPFLRELDVSYIGTSVGRYDEDDSDVVEDELVVPAAVGP